MSVRRASLRLLVLNPGQLSAVDIACTWPYLLQLNADDMLQ